MNMAFYQWKFCFLANKGFFVQAFPYVVATLVFSMKKRSMSTLFLVQVEDL